MLVIYYGTPWIVLSLHDLQNYNAQRYDSGRAEPSLDSEMTSYRALELVHPSAWQVADTFHYRTPPGGKPGVTSISLGERRYSLHYQFFIFLRRLFCVLISPRWVGGSSFYLRSGEGVKSGRIIHLTCLQVFCENASITSTKSSDNSVTSMEILLCHVRQESSYSSCAQDVILKHCVHQNTVFKFQAFIFWFMWTWVVSMSMFKINWNCFFIQCFVKEST